MEVKVNTGGMKEFVYPKDYNPRNTPEQDLAMDRAWEKARKIRKRNKRIKWITILIITLVIIFLIKTFG